MAEIGRRVGSSSSSSFREESRSMEDETELQWAAIERLPTYTRLRTCLMDNGLLNGQQDQTLVDVDVTKLKALQRRVFIEKLITKIEDDNRRLLLKLKDRIQKVGLKLPTLEVRFQNLCVEAEGKVKILKDVSGLIKPSRMSLLLGPPGCGKTTLLQALSGKLSQSLKVTGEVLYNGFKFNEFVPQKTSAYISQHDLHIAEMTVRETLDFSARCQGTGSRTDIMKEVIRREKVAGIIPEADVDTYMKAISIEGLKRTIQTDYILKILGLDNCAETIVGDAMRRGISGGEKKRLTTGEMIVGPTRALFMDEISNGLDSSTTFQIVTCLQQLTHILDSTILVSLLQPAPETFDLFDDVILMAEGKIVYHGPRSYVVEFFEHCGFKCPSRKGVADFLQEVVSRKDQAQYWSNEDIPYSYVSVDKFVDMFQEFHAGQKLNEELSKPYKSESDKNSLSFNKYSIRTTELFKACLSREWLLMKRNAFVYIFKSSQLAVIAIITMTVFIRTQMKTDAVDATYILGSLFYALTRLLTNGIAELALTVTRLPILYKQRDIYFYPAWACALPSILLKVPFSMFDAFIWTAITYYVIGYSPEPERFFRQFLILFFLHQVSVSLFRLIASIIRDPPVAVTCGHFSTLVMFLFGGFLIPHNSLPIWLKWGFWISPMTYAEIGISVNEFLSPKWQKNISSNNTTLGHQVLKKRGLDFSAGFYWISIGALLGLWVLFNVAYTLALTYLKSPGSSQTVISRAGLSHLEEKDELRRNASVEKELGPVKNLEASAEKNTGMVLPFEPVTLTFENVKYYVDTPKKLRDQGFTEKKLQLLQDITGAFRPGKLMALMGVSGAGKTTLMDVLSGRKTGGFIEGEIRIGGYPKVQETYARVSGYCEQTDIHSPQVTVEESVIFSAWLRLPSHIDKETKSAFVQEVLQLIELDEIKHALVGVPGVSGISNEQRKRLTVAVELVSNPSIIFMDEPTSGLDARAAAIVMRVVKNIVLTQRTIVCTIHQPSIDIFETFDELILMKRGGQMIYSGELGQHSSKLIEYFEDIAGVPKIKENYNPATWMLEVTSPASEAQLGLDFADLYKKSSLYEKNKELVKELSLPAQGSKQLSFPTKFCQNGWEQFKACLWRLSLTYWRSPKYNLTRLIIMIVSSTFLGALLWRKGQKIYSEQDFLMALGGMFIFVQTLGIINCSGVVPFVSKERNVLYRERFAGMYSSLAYSLAQVVIEVPYSLAQAVVFTIITYPAIHFYWSTFKVFMYFYSMLASILFFNYFGMVVVSVTPNFQVATICEHLGYTMLNLFAGFLIPGPKIPKWWVWAYWMCPTAWSLKALFTSQYGDIKEEAVIYGERQAVNAFLESRYGYKHSDLPIIGVVLPVFPLFCALVFTYATSKLNFQKR